MHRTAHLCNTINPICKDFRLEAGERQACRGCEQLWAAVVDQCPCLLLPQGTDPSVHFLRPCLEGTGLCQLVT